MTNTTFIYALCEPGTRTVRYIGKTDRPKTRMGQHIRESSKKKSYLGAWLRSLKLLELVPDMVILREVPSDQWEMAEERYIRIARGFGMKLVNLTKGGGGIEMTPEICGKISSSKTGVKASEDTLRRMRKPKSSEHRLNLRKAFSSPETFEKRSKANSGVRNPQYGKTRTAEARAKTSEAGKASMTPERKAEISKSLLGFCRGPCQSFRKLPAFSDGGGI